MSDALRFAWDPGKAASNLRKHGVSFVEAMTVFDDPRSLTDDDRGPHEQIRFYTLGRSHASRVLFVVHAEQDDDIIRIISARLATRNERKRYESST